MAHLILRYVHTPERAPQIVPLASGLRMGRREDNDVVINDVTISRYHIRFEASEQGWQVFDNGSTSGIYINDCLCHDGQVLVDGDALRIGGILLTYCENDGAA